MFRIAYARTAVTPKATVLLLLDHAIALVSFVLMVEDIGFDAFAGNCNAFADRRSMCYGVYVVDGEWPRSATMSEEPRELSEGHCDLLKRVIGT